MNEVARHEIDVADVAAGLYLLDVREYDEWMAGHAPSAVHIPMHDVPGRWEEVPRDQPVVCICRSGNRSAAVTGWLRARGVDALNMVGGMRQWSVEGRPIVNGDGRDGVVI